MKLLHVCIAVIISLSLGLAAAPVNSLAKDAVKETVKETVKSKASTSSATSSKSATKSTASAAEKVAAKAVNINTASKEELQLLPGVGPATADAIIKYRKANGKFKSANDLMSVKGIGEKTLSKMKPLLKF